MISTWSVRAFCGYRAAGPQEDNDVCDVGLRAVGQLRNLFADKYIRRK